MFSRVRFCCCCFLFEISYLTSSNPGWHFKFECIEKSNSGRNFCIFYTFFFVSKILEKRKTKEWKNENRIEKKIMNKINWNPKWFYVPNIQVAERVWIDFSEGRFCNNFLHDVFPSGLEFVHFFSFFYIYIYICKYICCFFKNLSEVLSWRKIWIWKALSSKRKREILARRAFRNRSWILSQGKERGREIM